MDIIGLGFSLQEMENVIDLAGILDREQMPNLETLAPEKSFLGIGNSIIFFTE